MIVTTRRDVRTGRKVGQGGGRWSKWHRDLTIQMRAKPGNDVRFTTLFDVYGLPPDFPGLAEAAKERTPHARVQRLEEAMRAALDDWRFIPYLQLHEFEAYVFVDSPPTARPPSPRRRTFPTSCPVAVSPMTRTW